MGVATHGGDFGHVAADAQTKRRPALILFRKRTMDKQDGDELGAAILMAVAFMFIIGLFI